MTSFFMYVLFLRRQTSLFYFTTLNRKGGSHISGIILKSGYYILFHPRSYYWIKYLVLLGKFQIENMIYLILIMDNFSVHRNFQTFYLLEWKFLKNLCSNREKIFWKIDSSKRIPELFLRNHKSVFYSFIVIYKIYYMRNSIPKFKGRLKIVCHPHRNAFNIDKMFFVWCFLLYRKIHLLSLVSYHLLISDYWAKNGNME